MLKTIEILKEEIKNSEKVKNTILGITSDWKTSHYNTLAQVINEHLINCDALQGEKKFELGNTISPITLKRFFEDKISESTTTDLRFIKTLDKLCIFIGYDSFNHFITKRKKGEPTQTVIEDDNSLQELIMNCARLEFKFLSELPAIDMSEIENYVIKDSPYYLRIKNYLQDLREQKKAMRGAPHSNYEVYGIETKTLNENLIMVMTQEFWNLTFDVEGGKPFLYHTLNSQNYFLKPIDGEWKIWDNHNPNVWELAGKK